MHSLHKVDIEQWRDTSAETCRYYGGAGDETCGAFWIPSPIDKAPLRVIASQGVGWDHVSVSRKNRCPNWAEMDYIKRLFFAPDEVCMQLHVAEAKHISVAHTCLHIWRPNDGTEIPLPPAIMVAPAG